MRFSRHYADIKCPFFVSETEKGLNCEGCWEGIDRDCKKFKTVEDKEVFIEGFCTHYPNNCPTYIAVDAKYERGYS